MQNSGPTERTVLLPPDAFSRLKLANKCVCGRGSAPDPAGGTYSAPPDPLDGLRGPISKGREEKGEGTKGEGKEGGEEGKERGGERKEREGDWLSLQGGG